MSGRESEPGCWKVDALDEEAQARAGGWSNARLWHWIDAAAWCAVHNPDVMALLTGYRDFRDRAHPAPVGEGACRIVALMHIAEPEIAKAERQLRAWCRAGVLEAIAIPTGTALTGADWEAGREPVASDMPLVMLPASIVRALSPAQFAETVEGAPANKADWGGECERVAALLDEEGVSVRDVRVHHILERWNSANGKAPKKDAITGYMTGKPRNGRPRKVSR